MRLIRLFLALLLAFPIFLAAIEKRPDAVPMDRRSFGR
jgi:hypothetical protein